MTLIRSRPSGYGTHVKLTSVEAEIIDSQLPYCLDSRGGTYVLGTADLTLNGPQSIVFGADLFMSGSELHISGTNAALIVASCFTTNFTSGLTQFIGDLTVSGNNTIFDGGDILVNGPVMAFQNNQLLLEATSSLVVQSSAEFDAATDFGDGILASTVDFNNNCSVSFSSGSSIVSSAPFANSGLIIMSGAGRIRKRVTVGTDTSSTYSVATSDVVIVPNLSTARNYTLTSTGAGEGDCIRFTGFANAAFACNLQNDSAVPLATIRNVVGGTPWADLVFTSGAWILVAEWLE
jgi:hypothetical protein